MAKTWTNPSELNVLMTVLLRVRPALSVPGTGGVAEPKYDLLEVRGPMQFWTI